MMNPGTNGKGGLRQRRAAEVMAELAAKKRMAEQRASANASPPNDAAAAADTTRPEQHASTGPIGEGEHEVGEGDCLSSIAKDTGHFWETIWAANPELKRIRKDPNVLRPGDRVTIPPLVRKEEPGETEMRHRFRRRGEPSMMRVRILVDDEPRGQEPYELVIDGREPITGTTTADGLIEAPIPGNAKAGVLRVGTEKNQLEYDLQMGWVDPVTELEGVQERLTNLGYACGPIDGVLGPRTEAAIRSFQKAMGLDETGTPDDGTRDRITREHGS